MPHFTLEYSANLDARVDMGQVVEVVRRAAVETGIFPLGGIRVRAIRCEHYAIADGQPHFGFLDMVLRLGQGRDLATRKKAGEHIFRALSDHLDPVFAQSSFALSFDMQINESETSWKRNNIPETLKAETTPGKPSSRDAPSSRRSAPPDDSFRTSPESRHSGTGPSDHPRLTKSS
jgi:5-carboxymethyl-2-hydroxymuconate isomerase